MKLAKLLVLDTRRVTADVTDAEPCSTAVRFACPPRKPIIPYRIVVEYAGETGKHTSVVLVGRSLDTPRLAVVTHELTYSPEMPDWVREFVNKHRPRPTHRHTKACSHRLFHIPLQLDSAACHDCGSRYTATAKCPARCVLALPNPFEV